MLKYKRLQAIHSASASASLPFALFIGPIVGYHISATPVYGLKNPDGHAQVTITPLFGHRSNGIQVAFTF